ncbi:hypothetical protein MRX96_039967 [Rhipicephalus microplus]
MYSLARATPCRTLLRSVVSTSTRCSRQRSTTPINTVIMFVPQQEAWVVERMGKFSRILEPGLNLLLPVIDRVRYVQSLKEIAIDIPQQSAITLDNVTLNIDGVLYLKVVDPYRASYGVEDPEFAITQLAQTTMRSELGKIALDSVFKERESLNIGHCGCHQQGEWCVGNRVSALRDPRHTPATAGSRSDADASRS